MQGFEDLKISVKAKFSGNYLSLSEVEKKDIIESLVNESREFDRNLQTGDVQHFFTLLKSTILFGYFTSEIGATQALRYVPIPGHQTGELPYNGERAWAL